MAKVLKVTFPQKCIGCELCVFEIQRQLGVVGLEGSLIRILRSRGEEGKLELFVSVDPKVNEFDVEKVRKICPTGVFTVEEGSEDDIAG